jgi:hypothetical protein
MFSPDPPQVTVNEVWRLCPAGQCPTRPDACRLVLIEILTDRAKLEQILKIFVLRGPVACLKKRKENRPVSFIVPKELLQCRHDPYFL